MNTADVLLENIKRLCAVKQTVIVSLDGRCASGKTTIAEKVRVLADCNVFHTDDFFLRPKQRTDIRYATPGENIDHERFLDDVLIPLSAGKPFAYRPYNFHSLTFLPEIRVVPKQVNLVEGSYSCHPSLIGYYDFKVFVTSSRKTQLERIRFRNGDKALEMFREKWIPLEEKYFEFYNLENKCDLLINTDEFETEELL